MALKSKPLSNVRDLTAASVQQAEVMIEAARAGQQLRREADVPFADARGRVAVRVEQFAEREFAAGNAGGRLDGHWPDCLS